MSDTPGVDGVVVGGGVETTGKVGTVAECVVGVTVGVTVGAADDDGGALGAGTDDGARLVLVPAVGLTVGDRVVATVGGSTGAVLVGEDVTGDADGAALVGAADGGAVG